MNPKVANLIAAELGILIGIMSWLAYSRFPSAEPPAAAEVKGRMVNSIPPDAPLLQPRSPRPYTVDYRADRERARPVNEQSASMAQEYDQEIATQPYANSGLDNGSIAEASPAYTAVDQQPAAVPADYQESPQIVNTQVVQIAAYSNFRGFPNRCRPAHHHGAINPIVQQCPDRGNSPVSGPRIVSGPNVNPPSGPPAQGPRTRGPVRQSGVTGSQQKRVAFPASPGPARRFAP